MKKIVCSRCKKNIAVVFISKVENGHTSHEGICIKCAKELGLSPVDDIISRMGISDDELDNINSEMNEAFESLESEDGEGDANPNANMLASFLSQSGLGEGDNDGDEDETASNTATFPFLDKLFGSMRSPDDLPAPSAPRKESDRLNERPGDRPFERAGEKTGSQSGQNKNANVKRKFLDGYCTNLNEKARTGGIDRIVGRGAEIERVVQILNRRQKNNPCLIGEPGVGKTAIAEGLATRIQAGDVPVKLRDKEVWLLDLTAVVAGTQFRGQFESRMKGLIDEVKKLGNIILVIDEVHNLVGAGDAEGSMNAANILKPALSRGEVQVIGATTFTEYRKHIEKDAALERRFQPVMVNEPSIEESVEIIKGIRKYYEDFHYVTISDEVARQAVVLSERYITDRFLPDKAIDLIDEASSAVNLKNTNLIEIDDLTNRIAAIRSQREELMVDPSDTAYPKLAELKSREIQLVDRLSSIKNERLPVTQADLARVIELWTKIPASQVCKEEYERILGLEDRLKTRVVGQDEAIKAVSAAIRRNRAGISYKRKPVSFIFAGPTGVGKTELVKQLANDLFDTPEALIRLDMSEFMEKHAVSRIIGAPPGYVGYDEAGQLTEKIRRKPYSVVLFDEIEKAHPDVLNILLQILDDGRITDAHGRVVSFENTMIIMTTNAGSDRNSGSPGFGRSVSEQGREKTMKALNDIMRPEFINRIDEIITFEALSEENFSNITLLMLGDLAGVLKERDIALSYDDALVAYLSKKGYSIKYGARNLRRLIQKEIEDKIAGVIIESHVHPISRIALTERDGAVCIESVEHR